MVNLLDVIEPVCHRFSFVSECTDLMRALDSLSVIELVLEPVSAQALRLPHHGKTLVDIAFWTSF